MNNRYYHRRRRASILVLTAVFMLLMFAILAFAVDLGYLTMARTQLQRTADSAAIAATRQLLDDQIKYGQSDPSVAIQTADDFTQPNKVLNDVPTLAQSDVIVGHLSNPFDPNEQLDQSGINGYNTVQVTVQRTATQNGVVPLFFVRMLGIDRAGSQAMTTAAYFDNAISGFPAPSEGKYLPILPFALDQNTWNSLMEGSGTDNWNVDTETKQVTSGSDAIKEINIYPQDTGSSGNSGTINIGTSNNGTANLVRQIQFGLNSQDLSSLGGKLALDGNGTIQFSGNPGISAGMKGALGEVLKPSNGSKPTPRILPLYSTVTGSGANTLYTIVRFVGVRIVDVDLTGSKKSNKRVIIQPASVLVDTGIIPGNSGQSTNVYSNWSVRLVR